jgi:hypothetical protein
MLRLMPLAALGLVLAACASPSSPPPPLPSPVSPAPGLPEDEARRAAIDANSWFARPQANQPARAARAHAELEFLAEALTRDPNLRGGAGQGLPQLQIARREHRAALGIPADAPAGAVVLGLRTAAEALERNERAAAIAALPSNVFAAGGEETLRRLALPPRVRSARPALVGLAQRNGGGN